MHEETLTPLGAGISAVIGIFVEINYKVAIVMVLLMILDIIIGTLFSFINGEFVSKEFKKGVVIKILIFLLALAMLLFLDVMKDYGVEIPFANTFGILLCFNEMFSIVETFVRNDVVVPKAVTKWFAQKNKELNSED